MDCIFCKIISGERKGRKVYEDELIYAFEDINPQAPVHILLVPKKHIPTLLDLKEEENFFVGQLYIITNTQRRNHHMSFPFMLDGSFRKSYYAE